MLPPWPPICPCFHAIFNKEQVGLADLTHLFFLSLPWMELLIGVTDCKRFVSKKENPVFASSVLAPRVSGHPDLLLVIFKVSQNKPPS